MAHSFTDLSPEAQERVAAEQQRTLRRLSGFGLARLATQAGVRQREVPADHWVLASDGASKATLALVHCPCGHRTAVAIGEAAKRCDCGRWFFYDGTRVWAFASPGGSDPA